MNRSAEIPARRSANSQRTSIFFGRWSNFSLSHRMGEGRGEGLYVLAEAELNFEKSECAFSANYLALFLSSYLVNLHMTA